jgi:hypothetical protein
MRTPKECLILDLLRVAINLVLTEPSFWILSRASFRGPLRPVCRATLALRDEGFVGAEACLVGRQDPIP